MPHLPSLAALPLDAHPTSVGYDDQSIDPSQMENTREFNVLIIQDENDMNVFGVDPKFPPDHARNVDLLVTRARFFEYMMDAIYNNQVFVPDVSVRFFKHSMHPMGRTGPWDDAFSANKPGVTFRSRGRYNETYEVVIANLTASAQQLITVLPTINAASVAFRKSTSFHDDRYRRVRRSTSVYDDNRRVLKELVMQARMSELELGPELHVAWCTTDPAGPADESDIVKIAHVCSINELFHGDLHNVFFVNNDKIEGRLNMDVQTGTHGFWEAVARCIVRGAKHGVVHFDLKGENMLYKKVEHPGIPGDYHYEVRYTDFDSRFFKIMDINNPVIGSRQRCLGILSLCQLLAVNRCTIGTRKFINRVDGVDQTVNVDWQLVFQKAYFAFSDEYLRVHGASVAEAFEDICSFDTTPTQPLKWGGSYAALATKDFLHAELNKWAKHYLAAVHSNCIELNELGDFFETIVRKIFQFALFGHPPGQVVHEEEEDSDDGMSFSPN